MNKLTHARVARRMVMVCVVAGIAVTGCRGQTALATPAATEPPPASPVLVTPAPSGADSPSPGSTSPTALDWASQPFAGVVSAVSYQKSTWIAAGRVATDPVAWTSDDGQTWIPHDVPIPVSPSYELIRMGPIAELAGDLYSIGVAMGAGDAVATIVWRSKDGSNWELVAPTGGGIEAGQQVWGLAATDNLLVAIANGFAAYSGEVWSSEDGSTWSQSTMPGAAAGAASELQFNDIAFDGTRLLIVGETYGHAGEAWLSADGGKWLAVEIQSESALKAVARASGIGSVTVGVSGELPAAWHSSDGEAWEPVKLPGESGEDAHAVIRLADAFVVLGTSPTGTITWTSADGSEWTRQPDELPDLADGYVGLIGSDLVATDGTVLITFLIDDNEKTIIWTARVR